MNKNINIIVVESSSIVCEGLIGIVNKSGLNCQFSIAGSLDEMEQLYARNKSELIIINPAFIQNNIKTFHIIRQRFSQTKWIGLVYAYFDQSLLSIFDALITISDKNEFITGTVQNILQASSQKQNNLESVLSEREIEVLKLLTTGLANKEIAEKLNISINTVISHRKNIAQKTGIKSVSGLTIYAVVQKYITIDTIKN
jgi:DNA-binding CsgD family transcriptional regulator